MCAPQKRIFPNQGDQGRFAWGSSDGAKILRISKVNSLKKGEKTTLREWEENGKRACDKREHVESNDRERVEET